jgi:hypothetical protein
MLPKLLPAIGLDSNPKRDKVEMRALSEPARVAEERQKEEHFFEEKMVPRVGLEPTLLSELDFESSASTNSTTGACTLCLG